MRIKNFKINKIDSYIKNFPFKFLIFLSRSKIEKQIIEINKIMSNFNSNNIKKKLDKIEEIYLRNSKNPFLTYAVAYQQIDKDKNPENGFKKMEDYHFLLKDWVKKKKNKKFQM